MGYELKDCILPDIVHNYGLLFLSRYFHGICCSSNTTNWTSFVYNILWSNQIKLSDIGIKMKSKQREVHTQKFKLLLQWGKEAGTSKGSTATRNAGKSTNSLDG